MTKKNTLFLLLIVIVLPIIVLTCGEGYEKDYDPDQEATNTYVRILNKGNVTFEGTGTVYFHDCVDTTAKVTLTVGPPQTTVGPVHSDSGINPVTVTAITNGIYQWYSNCETKIDLDIKYDFPAKGYHENNLEGIDFYDCSLTDNHTNGYATIEPDEDVNPYLRGEYSCFSSGNQDFSYKVEFEVYIVNQ